MGNRLFQSIRRSRKSRGLGLRAEGRKLSPVGEHLEPRQLLAVDLVQPIADQTWSGFSSEPLVVPIQETFSLTDVHGTVVRFATNAPQANSDFYVELYDTVGSAGTLTPATVANFLAYVDDGSYSNTMIYRAVSDFVVQGGGFTAPSVAADQPGSDPVAIPTKGTITNEPGNSNLRGTLAMAKLGGQPNSATSQWFVNLSDSTFLDTDNGGYTVFGEVLGDGMAVVDVLASAPSYDATTYYSNNAFNELPLWNVNADNIVQPEDFVRVDSIELAAEHELLNYSVTTSDAAKLTGVVSTEGNLVLTPAVGATGTVTVTIAARSITDGSTRSDSFDVYLGDLFGSGFVLQPIRSTLPEDVSTAEPIRLASIDFIEAATVEGLSLGGPDAALFEFGERLTAAAEEHYVQLRAGVELDYETKPRLEVSVSGYNRSRTVVLQLTDENDRPELFAWKSPRLTTIEPNLGPPANGSVFGSTLVRDLINQYPLANYADQDGDAAGIAVTKTNLHGGMLWYTTNNGQTWAELGEVSERSAVALYADFGTRLYFEPGPEFNGQVDDLISFKAWDRSGRHQNGDRGVDTLPELGWEPIESWVDTGALVEQVAVSPDGKTAYATNRNSLVIIDISVPESPTIVSQVYATEAIADVAVHPSNDGLVVVADSINGLKFIDVSDKANPRLMGTQVVDGRVDHVAFSGDGRHIYASAATGWGATGPIETSLSVTRVDNAETLPEAILLDDWAWSFLGDLTFTGEPGEMTEFNAGDHVAVAAGWGGLVVVDVSSKSSPAYVTRFLSETEVLDVVTDEVRAVLYVAENNGVHRLDVTNPSVPVFAGWAESSEPSLGVALSADGRTLFVAQSDSSTAVYDVSGDGDFDGVGRYHKTAPGVDVQAVDVALAGQAFVVVAEASSVALYELGEASDVLDIAPMQSPGGQILVDESRGVAYVNDGWRGLNIFDVSDATSIVALGRVETAASGGASHATVFGPGGHLFVADGDAGVTVFEPSSSGVPELMLTTQAAGRVLDVVNLPPDPFPFHFNEIQTPPPEVLLDGSVYYPLEIETGPVRLSGQIGAVVEGLGVEFFEFRQDVRSLLEYSNDGGDTWIAIPDAVFSDWQWEVEGLDVAEGITFRIRNEIVGRSLVSQGLLPVSGALFATIRPGRVENDIYEPPLGEPVSGLILFSPRVAPLEVYVIDSRYDDGDSVAVEVWRRENNSAATARISIGGQVWSKVSRTGFTSWPGRLAVDGDRGYAYATVGGDGLRVLDLSEMESALYNFSRAVATDAWAGDVAISTDGRYAYVANLPAGVAVIDVTVPENSRVVRHLDTRDTAASLTLSTDGNVLYVGDWAEGLIAFDVGPQAKFSAATDTAAVTVLPPVAPPVVSLPNVEVDPTAVFTVGVETANLSDLISATFTVAFDATVIEPVAVRAGSSIGGWLVTSSFEVPGEVTISAAGVSAALPTGTLFEIDFRAIGDRGAATLLDITTAEFNGGAVVAHAIDGSVQIDLGGSVSGRVTYYSDPSRSVPGVAMQYHPWNDLGPAVVLATFTDWAGRYTINDPDGGYLRVTPAGRSSEWARLAGPITEGISSWDASLVLRYNAGLISLTDFQLIAGDVDLSGAVNAYDAALILRKAAGYDVAHLGWQREWSFLPSTREYFDLQSDLTGQDYTGILLGDVSGDWTPDVFVIDPRPLPVLDEPLPFEDFSQSASISSRRLASTAVLLHGRATLPGSRGKVGLSMNGGAGDVYSLDAVVSFDPTQLRLTKSDLESNLTSGMVLLNEIGPGRVKVVIASTQPIPRGETLIALRPQLISGAGDATLTLERVELNEGNLASRPVSATIERMQVIEDSGDIVFGKDREGRHFAGNTPMKYRGAEVSENLFGVWSVVGAEKVRGRNVSYVKRGDEVEPIHVWRMSESWDFGGIESLGNVNSQLLSGSRGDATEAAPPAGSSREDIESVGAVTLRRDIDGRLFANDVAVLFAGGALMQPFEGTFQPIAAEVVGGENQILFQNDEGVIRRTIHRSDWAFVAVDGLEPEGVVMSAQQEPEQLRLQRNRMIAFAEQDFGVELTGDGVVGLPLSRRPAAP